MRIFVTTWLFMVALTQATAARGDILPFEDEPMCVEQCVEKCHHRSNSTREACFNTCADRPPAFKNLQQLWNDRSPLRRLLKTSLELHKWTSKISAAFTPEKLKASPKLSERHQKLLNQAKALRQQIAKDAEKATYFEKHILNELDSLLAAYKSEDFETAQDLINKMLDLKKLDTHTDAPSIACILASQKNKSDPVCKNKTGKRTFFSCPVGGADKRIDLPPDYAQPLCRTERNVKLVHQSFHDVANCMGMSQEEKKQLFMLFNHESNFMNAESCTYAGCFGQLTSVSLDNSHPKLRQFLNKKKPTCYRVNMYFEKLNVRPGRTTNNIANRCTLIQNPYSCFMYSMYEYRSNKNHARELITQFNLTHKQTVHETLFVASSKVTEDDLLDMLALWSYNAGIGTLRGRLNQVFNDLLASMDRTANMILILFPKYAECLIKKQSPDCKHKHITMPQFVEGFKKYLDRSRIMKSLEPARRHEVSNFFYNIVNSTSRGVPRQRWLSKEQYDACRPDLHKKMAP